MKAILGGALVLLLASSALAQAPSVNQNTGDLSVGYPFELPRARGRYQPELALIYSSANTRDVGFGLGWTLTSTYLEWDSRGSPGTMTLWLVRGAERRLLVFLGSTYRPEVEESFFEVTSTGPGFTAKDAAGNAYVFDRHFGNRHSLTRVTDLDGNITEYAYDSMIPDATVVRYNKSIGGTFFGTVVTLEHSNALLGTDGTPVPPQPTAAADGLAGQSAFITNDKHLLRVRIEGANSAGTIRTIRGYELAYTPAAVGNGTSIAQITQRGLDLVNTLPPTKFAYRTATGFLREAPTSAALIDSYGSSLIRVPMVPSESWTDLDGDGRPDSFDWATGSSLFINWQRNLTPIGSASVTFAPVQQIPVPAKGKLQDFDGDGRLDIVIPSYSESQHIDLYLGDGGPGAPHFSSVKHTLSVGSFEAAHEDLTTHEAVPSARTVITDINGDGVTDFAYLMPDCGGTPPACWKVGLTVLRMDGTSYVDVQPANYVIVPGARPAPTTPPDTSMNKVVMGADINMALDVNGDGRLDWVRNNATMTAGPKDSYLTTSDSWLVKLLTGTGEDQPYVDWGQPGMNGFDDHPEIVMAPQELPDPLGVCGAYTGDDGRFTTADLQDFNGDGRPDFYVFNPSTGGRIAWNTGRGFTPLATISVSDYLSWGWAQQYALGGADVGGNQWRSGASSCSSTSAFYDCCFNRDPIPNLAESWMFQDFNGDGIPDSVGFQYSGPNPNPAIRLARGTLSVADGALGALEIGRPMVLARVETPDGAVYLVDYVPSTTFGMPRSRLKPAVAAVTVSGVALAAGKTLYWYSSPTSGRAWYDPAKPDDFGFSESWSQDATTKQVQHTTWFTGRHALIGKAQKVELAVPSTLALGIQATTGSAGSQPWSVVVYSSQVATYRTRNLGNSGACDSSESYPLRVIPTSVAASQFYGSTESQIATAVSCSDVDSSGNVLKSTVTPSIAGISGNVLVTRQSFSGTTQCPNIPATLVTWREDVQGNRLSEERKTFDSACRLTAQWSPPTLNSSAKTNWTTFTYGGPFNQLSASTTGGVSKGIAYDTALGLHVVSETTEDAQTRLLSGYEVDFQTGLRTHTSGPYPTKRNGAAFTAGANQSIERYYLYDAFGRQVAVGKTLAPALGGLSSFVPAASTVQNVVEYTEYGDTAIPRSTVHYRYSVPVAVQPGSPRLADDVFKSVEYRDGLGRVIQVRERMGGGGTAATGARVNQYAAGFKVSQAVIFDGAGRELATLEPFYGETESFVDYAATGALPAVRGTVTTYDDQLPSYSLTRRAAPTCVSHQWLAGGNLPGAALACTSNSTHSTSYRQATEAKATTRTVAGRGPFGGYFIEKDAIPPDVNDANVGGTAPRVSLVGPAGEELGIIDGDGNRTWIERDAMGREVASWRESSSGTPRTPQPVSRTFYNLAGQVSATWDGNFDAVTRTNTYDDAGRLTYVTTDPATTEGIAYVYAAGDLGRASEVWTCASATNCTTTAGTRVAKNHYDFPYPIDPPDAGYSFESGKLSWTENADTTVIYGYDDAGRVWRRDQWFTKLSSSGRFTVSSTYGGDGRVLESRVVNPYDTTKTYRYNVDYDSAARPVALSGNYINASDADVTTPVRLYQAATPAGETHGAYDALGRVPVMKADDGRVVSARVYNGYSGALTGECKKFSTGTTCSGSVNASTDLFRTDATEATYQGGKLKGFRDDLTSTQYTMTYLPSGRLSSLQAVPTSTVGTLTQDWTESYSFNGVGNLQSVGIHRNDTPGDARPDFVATSTYVPESPASGQVLDRAKTISTSVSTGTTGVTAGSLSLEYDLLGHLTRVSRTAGTNERLYYAPGGELLYRQVDDKFVFYVGEYATVTASSTVTGCSTSCGTKPCACTPSAGSVEVDAHVVFAGTRIASAKPTRTLFYYRTRLGSVIATSQGGGAMGAMYRYDPYGKLELATGDTSATSSELGYTNALKLSGGLLYLKNRVYDTEARVFVQPDSVDRLRYAYVQGDPVNFADPTGLLAVMMNGWDRTMVDLDHVPSGGSVTVEVPKKQATSQASNPPAAGPKPSEATGQASGTALTNVGAVDSVQQAADAAGKPTVYTPAGLPRNKDSGTYSSPEAAHAAAGRRIQSVADQQQREYGWQVRDGVGANGKPEYYYTQFLRDKEDEVRWTHNAKTGAVADPGSHIESFGHAHPKDPWYVPFRANLMNPGDQLWATVNRFDVYVSTPDGHANQYINRLKPDRGVTFTNQKGVDRLYWKDMRP